MFAFRSVLKESIPVVDFNSVPLNLTSKGFFIKHEWVPIKLTLLPFGNSSEYKSALVDLDADNVFGRIQSYDVATVDLKLSHIFGRTQPYIHIENAEEE